MASLEARSGPQQPKQRPSGPDVEEASRKASREGAQSEASPCFEPTGKTAAMMRNVSEGAGGAPGQDDEPQAVIWYYADDWGKWLLGHNGGDDGIDTDAFFNPETGVGFIAFTNGDHDTYQRAMVAIETRLMATFDTAGGWPPPEDVPASADAPATAYVRRRAQARRRPRRSAACSLPE